jgi:lipoate---protein ligase
MLVLGSTQPPGVVDEITVREYNVELARRRGGGGAVYLAPGQQLWLDAWIPRDDPLWTADVSVAAEWAGAWWAEALTGVGLSGFDVHRGRAVPGTLGELVCFAGRGPGEVFQGDRKVVGLSQWRSRQGALFSTCAYLHWDPWPLMALLEVDADGGRGGAVGELGSAAAGLADLDPPVTDLDKVRRVLLDSFPGFGVTGSPAA